jgi:hypothetical protein
MIYVVLSLRAHPITTHTHGANKCFDRERGDWKYLFDDQNLEPSTSEVSMNELLQDALSRRCISVPRKAIDHVLWPDVGNTKNDSNAHPSRMSAEPWPGSAPVSPHPMFDSGATGLLEREMVKVETLTHNIAALEKVNQQQQEEIATLESALKECENQRDRAFEDLRTSDSPGKGLAEELVMPTFDLFLQTCGDALRAKNVLLGARACRVFPHTKYMSRVHQCLHTHIRTFH